MFKVLLEFGTAGTPPSSPRAVQIAFMPMCHPSGTESQRSGSSTPDVATRLPRWGEGEGGGLRRGSWMAWGRQGHASEHGDTNKKDDRAIKYEDFDHSNDHDSDDSSPIDNTKRFGFNSPNDTRANNNDNLIVMIMIMVAITLIM